MIGGSSVSFNADDALNEYDSILEFDWKNGAWIEWTEKLLVPTHSFDALVMRRQDIQCHN